MGNVSGKHKPPPDDRVVLKMPNGDSYKGHHSHRVPHGHGKLKFASGNFYVGQFKQGVLEGEGKMFYDNGEFYTGHW